LGAQTPPANDEGIVQAHNRLYDATGEFLQIHRRAESEPVSSGLIADSESKQQAFAEALEAWYEAVSP
jgi:hypothetical protein